MAGPLRNWGTMVRELQLLCRRASGDLDAIKRSLCQAIEHHEQDQIWFKQGRFQVQMVADQARYRRGEGASGSYSGVPGDLESITGDLEVWPSGSELRRVTLRSMPREVLERSVVGDPSSSSVLSGQPASWGWYGEELLISPTPSNSADVVVGAYTRSLGTPYALYESSAWVFKKPDGLTMSDDYPNASEGEVNAWFGDGYPMILWRASFVLNQNYLRDDSEAGASLARWSEEISRQQATTATRRRRREVQGYL